MLVSHRSLSHAPTARANVSSASSSAHATLSAQIDVTRFFRSPLVLRLEGDALADLGGVFDDVAHFVDERGDVQLAPPPDRRYRALLGEVLQRLGDTLLAVAGKAEHLIATPRLGERRHIQPAVG